MGRKTKEITMPDPATDPDDPDLAAHDALAALVDMLRGLALPEAAGPDPVDPAVFNFPRAQVWAILTVGLLLDKRLAMSERHRG